jgi:hypothetical protein
LGKIDLQVLGFLALGEVAISYLFSSSNATCMLVHETSISISCAEKMPFSFSCMCRILAIIQGV